MEARLAGTTSVRDRAAKFQPENTSNTPTRSKTEGHRQPRPDHTLLPDPRTSPASTPATGRAASPAREQLSNPAGSTRGALFSLSKLGSGATREKLQNNISKISHSARENLSQLSTGATQEKLQSLQNCARGNISKISYSARENISNFSKTAKANISNITGGGGSTTSAKDQVHERPAVSKDTKPRFSFDKSENLVFHGNKDGKTKGLVKRRLKVKECRTISFRCIFLWS